jgi:hypothetical protein
MSKLAIGIGTLPNDGAGDTLRDGAIKINTNFDEIYSALGTGTTITNSIGFAFTSGISSVATYAINAGLSSYSSVSGLTTYAPISGIASVSNYSTVAGVATNATYANNLVGNPDIIVGIITASKFEGSGTFLTGVITSIVAGTNVTIDSYAGIATINSLGGGGGGGSSQWKTNVGGIATTSKVGVGTDTTDVSSLFNVYGGKLRVNGLTSGDRAVDIQSGTKIFLGGDANIYYDGADLRFDTGSSVRIGDGSRDIFTARSGEGSELYYDNSKKLQTTATGISVIGSIISSGFTTSTHVYSSGGITAVGSVTAASFVGDGGNIAGIVTTLIAGSNVILTENGGEITIDVNSDSVWNGNATGINTLGNVGVGTTTATHKLTVLGESSFDGAVGFTSDITITSGGINCPADANIKFGSDVIGSGSVRNIGLGDRSLNSINGGGGHNIAIGDLALQVTSNGQYNIAIGDRAGREVTTGNNNVIIGGFTGNNSELDIRTSDNTITLSDGEGNIGLFIASNGNVAIRTTFTNEALNVLGIVSATSFHGQLNAEQLTGVLPIIDGSNLTGVTAVGSGIELENNGSSIGVAATVNFSSNLDVSLSAGVATVSVSDLSITDLTVSGESSLGVADATQLTVSGILISSGSSLTSLNASELSSGTIPDARFPATLPAASGASLTSLNASELSSGTIPDARFPATLPAASGTNLTNLSSSQLTGALPAIDGSALTGVVASGTGIAIESNGFPVGSATTIDLGSGLSVEVSAGVATITSGAGGGRTIVSGSTTSITDGSIGNIDITGNKTYALMKIGLSTTGWIRLYTDSTSRANDINRGLGTDPVPGSGVIAEVVTTGISTQQIVSPFAMGGNLMDPVDTTIYASITNLSGSTQTITANLTILPLEV